MINKTRVHIELEKQHDNIGSMIERAKSIVCSFISYNLKILHNFLSKQECPTARERACTLNSEICRSRAAEPIA